MADPRFYDNHGPFTLKDLAELGGAELAAEADPERLVRDIGPLETAGVDELSFLDNAAYVDAFANSRAGACVVEPRHQRRAPEGMALLLGPHPYQVYARIAQAFYPLSPLEAGIAESADIDPTATLGEGVEVGANVVVGAQAAIGARSLLGPGVVVGAGVVIGEECRLHAGVVVSHSLVGNRVTLHPGAKLGQDGFGFAMAPSGHIRVPQVGRVIVGDDCVIGANTTIDRGHLHDTVIGPGCWIDNLVQIGHNVELGKGCVIVAQAGISGSTKLGDFVALGGQAGLTGHLKIGDGAQIGAQAGVMADVPAGTRVVGSPAQPIGDFFRQMALLRRLDKRRGKKDE
ncbi:MAG: UDP-3-O-(3-hydroxymyristoyl)glucosamine N-acyltransferase [Alphaproteobacteria bacterium]|jgi:UDP-3-O-[3-hydroxymyristoyl] glucosamine N-acyltransferase|nr:UDP-3-O-(3-hydroxymyristoyl)glucosamine N-acyltransferase [Alphaproteobacteria bacterium]